MDPKKKADEFVSDLQALIKKHYGEIKEADAEPLGMKLRQVFPIIDIESASGITTTATISIPWDTDPPDSD